MELEELKNMWQKEDKDLDGRIRINEERLLKVNLENTTAEINKIIKMSLFGRNMALVYCFISLGLAVSVIEEIEYSVPAIVGAFGMLWSFISHLSIEKPNYTNSIIQVQKTICTFRIHLAANARYDILMFALWYISVMPIFLKIAFNFSLYNNHRALSAHCLISVVVLTLIIALSRKAYKDYDQQLKRAESDLVELIKFEK